MHVQNGKRGSNGKKRKFLVTQSIGLIENLYSLLFFEIIMESS